VTIAPFKNLCYLQYESFSKTDCPFLERTFRPLLSNSCCLTGAGGISIWSMFAKKLAACSALISMSLSLADVGLLLSLCLPKSFSFEQASCPMRSEHCCCPEVCHTPEKRPAERHVHQARGSHPEQNTGRSSSSVCVLKAGCAEGDSFLTSGLFQKESLLQHTQAVGTTTLKVSFVLSDRLFHVLPGYSPPSFHPPRSS